MNKLALSAAGFLLSAITAAQAHTPIIDDGAKTLRDPMVIEDPAHSKAIFSTLQGDAQYYRFSATDSFDFYVGITAPKLDACDLQRTFSFDILNDRLEVIDSRDGDDFDWWPWYEEYGKTWYWVGPEIGEDFGSTQQLPAGTYYVRVYNDTNLGEYALAIGDEERMGIGTMLRLPGTLRTMRNVYWDDSECN